MQVARFMVKDHFLLRHTAGPENILFSIEFLFWRNHYSLKMNYNECTLFYELNLNNLDLYILNEFLAMSQKVPRYIEDMIYRQDTIDKLILSIN